MNQQLSNDNEIQFSAAQTSREVKKHLKKMFPHMEKLSVTLKNFSLRISWENGPSIQAVEEATRVFAGAQMVQNGGDMIKGYTEPVEFQGKKINFGIDFIFCERELSEENQRIIERYVADKYGYDDSVNHHDSRKRIWDLEKAVDANDFPGLVWAPIESTLAQEQETITSQGEMFLLETGEPEQEPQPEIIIDVECEPILVSVVTDYGFETLVRFLSPGATVIKRAVVQGALEPYLEQYHAILVDDETLRQTLLINKEREGSHG